MKTCGAANSQIDTAEQQQNTTIIAKYILSQEIIVKGSYVFIYCLKTKLKCFGSH